MRRFARIALVAIAALAVMSLTLAACDDDGEEEGTGTPEGTAAADGTGTAAATGTAGAESETAGPDAVTVQLETLEGDEWDISTDTDPLPAGQIVFEITNPAGNEHEHEVEVLLGASGTDQDELGEVEEIQPGETKTLVITLEPGQYELACNINEEHEGEEIDHYERGMHRDIEVVAQ